MLERKLSLSRNFSKTLQLIFHTPRVDYFQSNLPPNKINFMAAACINTRIPAAR